MLRSHFSAEQLIRVHDLRPHPEGGYFRETYRSAETLPGKCLPARYGGSRSYSTAIYYLLPSGSVSQLHRIASDELWHFYLGGPLTIAEFKANGSTDQVVLGQAVDQGQRLQHVVKAGTWFGAFPSQGSHYSFLGCTVAPGFDFLDFELATRTDLLIHYPDHREIITRLTAP